MDPAQWLADYNNRLAEAAAGAKAAAEGLRTAGARATSPRGEVTVTVNAAGALEDLALTPAARRLEVEALAQLIVTTARQARHAAGAHATAILTHHFGDGPALDLIRSHAEAPR
ncbi:YbaB/EbfC family nucleoid-associated protein [Actinokineospora sp. UTMC 2448]|uniref:YbaB/EbfC family nucleoid-associated protein n=1 Tax=Actinokineospora sp. UTMC 2448 TaxID=2268449 RepID=UPI0021642260|nr:YbaB/EbfC family nucleoid-associated protein [Actinokineospora sp. UTMC 2448]UVS78769.1 hypothetical protein Actkin_02505 [Actinokineospora sp. UTMC 2448]